MASSQGTFSRRLQETKVNDLQILSLDYKMDMYALKKISNPSFIKKE